MKQNKISVIMATKGSGKTLLATALSIAQDKPLFMISPIQNSFYTHFRDKINETNVDDDILQGITYVYYAHTADELEALLKDIQESFNNGVCIMIDEIDFYYKNLLNKELELYKIINYGRHKEIDLIVLARRLQDTPKAIVSQADVFYIGNIGQSYNDYEYIKKQVGKSYADIAQTLEKGSFIKLENHKANLIKLPSNVVSILTKER